MSITRRRKHRGGEDPNQDLLRAVMAKDIESVKRLLQDPRVDPNTKEGAPLVHAANNGSVEIAKILLQDPRVDPSLRDQLALSYACMNGRLPIVKLLLQDTRVDPSGENQRPLKDACEHGRAEVVRLLLKDPRVDPSVDNQAPIQLASTESGDPEVVKLLLQDPRVDPTAGENIAVLTAAKEGREDILEVLLNDPRVQQCDYIYEWPLEARRWSKESKKVFARTKAKRDIKRKARNTLALKQTERHGFKDLPNNVKGYLGTFVSGKVGPTLQSHMNQLKKNHNAVGRTRKKYS